VNDTARTLTLQAVFSSGSARLVVVANRLVYVSDAKIGSRLHLAAANATNHREFAFSCLECWFASGTRPDLIALSVEATQVRVFAIGAQAIAVVTDRESDFVDPSGASIAVERTVQGSFDSASIGSKSDHIRDCFVSSGLVAVNTFEITMAETAMDEVVFNGVLASELTAASIEATATEVTANDATATEIPAFEISPNETSVRSEHSVTGPELSVGIVDGIERDRVSGATVFLHQMDAPSEPGKTVFFKGSPDDSSERIVPRERPPERVPTSSSDATVFSSDQSARAKSLVALVPSPTNHGESDQVVGVFCVDGHFTDSRQPVCLFCGADTDLDRIETGTRPSLGSLEFDDGRSVRLTCNVVIGRRPSSATTQVQVVAFADDKMMSRNHTEFRLIDWKVVVVDLGSANGTKLDSGSSAMELRPNIETKIHRGSVVRFGAHSCTYWGD
jgi:hypothetical protein